MTTWLITGGAGYIGSHIVRALQESGRKVVVLDDFSSGLERKVPAGVPIVRASIADRAAIAEALRTHLVDGVIHLAAKKAAGESVLMPLYYYRENVSGMVELLAAMSEVGVAKLVYSSSAAVYGTPVSNPIAEDALLKPESPYGETKVVGEWLTRNAGIADGVSWVALRYFNVAGAANDELGDTSINNLIPMVFRALENGERPQIFGDDYPTSDGTCIRDYIHVADLADAHVVAAARCESSMSAEIFNVGRGVGSSVREVMETIGSVLDRDIDPEVVPRRVGDPPASTAATDRIAKALGWRASYDLRAMVSSAWSAWQTFPPN
ncbi:MAG: UDP-glucose 4-epimerase GalE [Actinomycetota bacterium]|nr:UDP-glucose 4-epimerase GalE [Actinomycetota bacterium]